MILLLLTAIAFTPAASHIGCAAGERDIAGVCVPERVAAFVVCVQQTTGGRVSVTAIQQRGAMSQLFLQASAQAKVIDPRFDYGHLANTTQGSQLQVLNEPDAMATCERVARAAAGNGAHVRPTQAAHGSRIRTIVIRRTSPVGPATKDHALTCDARPCHLILDGPRHGETQPQEVSYPVPSATSTTRVVAGTLAIRGGLDELTGPDGRDYPIRVYASDGTKIAEIYLNGFSHMSVPEKRLTPAGGTRATALLSDSAAQALTRELRADPTELTLRFELASGNGDTSGNHAVFVKEIVLTLQVR